MVKNNSTGGKVKTNNLLIGADYDVPHQMKQLYNFDYDMHKEFNWMDQMAIATDVNYLDQRHRGMDSSLYKGSMHAPVMLNPENVGWDFVRSQDAPKYTPWYGGIIAPVSAPRLDELDLRPRKDYSYFNVKSQLEQVGVDSLQGPKLEVQSRGKLKESNPQIKLTSFSKSARLDA